jgi:hypothetical protein
VAISSRYSPHNCRDEVSIYLKCSPHDQDLPGHGLRVGVSTRVDISDIRHFLERSEDLLALPHLLYLCKVCLPGSIGVCDDAQSLRFLGLGAGTWPEFLCKRPWLFLVV